MGRSAIISIKATTDTARPVNVIFKNRSLWYTVEIGILPDEHGILPAYNPPIGDADTVDQILKYLRDRGFEPLAPLIEHKTEIRNFINRQAFSYMYYGGPSLGKILHDYARGWVRDLKSYIKGFTAPPLSETTIKIRKWKKKKYGYYFNYPEKIDHPLIETGTLLASITYRVTKNETGQKRDIKGRSLQLTDYERRGRVRGTKLIPTIKTNAIQENKRLFDDLKREKQKLAEKKKSEKEKKESPPLRAKDIPTSAKKVIKSDFGIFIADTTTQQLTVVGHWSSITPKENTKGDTIPFSMATEEAAGKAVDYFSQSGLGNTFSSSLMHRAQVRFWKHVLRAAQGGLFKGLGGSK